LDGSVKNSDDISYLDAQLTNYKIKNNNIDVANGCGVL
jgi:hypothetical protein